MAFQPEASTFDSGVFQLETSTPVQGGVGGASNSPLVNLTNRTKYLKDHVDALEAAATGNAPINSPTFTGDPKGPTPAAGDSDTSLATTAFVQNAVGGIATVNVAGGVNVNLTAVQYGAAIIILTGAITANIAVIFPTTGDRWQVVNNTSGAFTVTCKTAAGTGVVVSQGKSSEIYCDATNIGLCQSDYDNVALGANPTAPTAPLYDSDTSIATTAFVQRALGNLSGVAAVVTGAAATLTSANSGQLVPLAGTGGTITLPLLSAVAPGTAIMMIGRNATGTWTIQRQGADTITPNATPITSFVLKPGETVIMVADAGTWNVIGGSAQLQFASSFGVSTPGSSGWQKLPSGLIIQWGALSTGGGGATVNFPIAFPSGALSVVATANAANTNSTVSTGTLTTTSFPIYSYTGGVNVGMTVDWIVIGI